MVEEERIINRCKPGILYSVVVAFMIIGSIVWTSYMLRASNELTSYIYSPGLFGSPVVIGRYCPYYVAPTGEEIHGTCGGNVLGDGTHITSVVFPEIDVEQSNSWFRQVIYPFVANKVLYSLFGIVVKENGASSKTFSNYIPWINRANIAQEADIAALREFLKAHLETYPGTHVVMYGDSRGAATTFNVIALDHPPIACAVLEGIFDSIPHLIKHCWRWQKKHPRVEEMMHKLLKTCTSHYADQGPFPIDLVSKIPIDMPLLLVTSLKDEIVPYQSTMRLYCKLKEHGCKYVHLLVLDNSSHKGYMIGKDRTKYESCVHAFYRTYEVAYKVKLAEKGQLFFDETQPTVAYVRERYHLSTLCCQ